MQTAAPHSYYIQKITRIVFVEDTISYSPEVTWARFLERNRLFCFICISKLGSFNNPFEMTTSLVKFHFRCWRCTLLVQTKEVISMCYSSSKESLKTMEMNKAWPNMSFARTVATEKFHFLETEVGKRLYL